MPEITKTQAEAFQRTKVYQEDKLVIWSVTTGTKDFGNRYVARPIVAPALHPRQEDGYLIADTLSGLRQKLPHGLSRMDRYPTDDPVIVETWF